MACYATTAGYWICQLGRALAWCFATRPGRGPERFVGEVHAPVPVPATLTFTRPGEGPLRDAPWVLADAAVQPFDIVAADGARLRVGGAEEELSFRLGAPRPDEGSPRRATLRLFTGTRVIVRGRQVPRAAPPDDRAGYRSASTLLTLTGPVTVVARSPALRQGLLAVIQAVVVLAVLLPPAIGAVATGRGELAACGMVVLLGVAVFTKAAPAPLRPDHFTVSPVRGAERMEPDPAR